MNTVKQAKCFYIICSALFCLTGISLIIFPSVAAKMICVIFGIIAIIYGLVKIFGYFSKDMYSLAFQFDLALGILVAVLGMTIVIYSEKISEFLPFVIGIFVAIEGVFKLQSSFDAKSFGLKEWWILLASALICVALGTFLMLNPSESGKIITVMIGISLLVDGLENLFTALYTVKTLKKSNMKGNIRK